MRTLAEPISIAIAVIGIIVSALEAAGVRVVSPAPSGPGTVIQWTPDEYRDHCLTPPAAARHPACPRAGLVERDDPPAPPR